MKTLLYILVLVVTVLAGPITIQTNNPNIFTEVTTKNVTSSKIDVKILNKSHHLFIGRCNPKNEILHEEHIILDNDGKSHVTAKIRVNMDGHVNITCINIYDETPNGQGGYPSFGSGGVGYNFIEFNVLTEYGKGFHFYIRIEGYTKTEKIIKNEKKIEVNNI